MFKDIDTTHKGVISKTEFVTVIKELGVGVSNHDIIKLMNRFDANRDGTISYSEFVAKLRDDG